MKKAKIMKIHKKKYQFSPFLLFSINFELLDSSKGILGGSKNRNFFVLGVAERGTNRSPHNTKQSLINSIIKVFANFDRESVVNTCSRVRFRLEEVVDVKGDFIR